MTLIMTFLRKFFLQEREENEKSFRKVVDATMHDVLNRVAPSKKEYDSKSEVSEEDDSESDVIVFDSMDEILVRGNTRKPYEKTRNETTNEVVISCGGDGNYSGAAIDKMLGESWASSKDEGHNFVWQRVYLEIFTSISESKESSKTMKAFNNQIADEYGNAVWNTIFDEHQRFFIMLWRMNTSYSCINPKQKKLISLIKGFYKSMNKANGSLGKEFDKLDLDYSNVFELENFFEALLREIKQDEIALTQMFKIRDYFAKGFSEMLWYGRFFSELQMFVIVCSEVVRANHILKQ